MLRLGWLGIKWRNAVLDGIAYTFGLAASAAFLLFVVVLCDDQMGLRPVWRKKGLFTVLCFGLLGLSFAYSIHGSGSDLICVTFAGLCAGVVLPMVGGLAAFVTGWFLTWMIACTAIASRGLELGAWSVLGAFGGLIAATVALLIVIGLVADDAMKAQSDEHFFDEVSSSKLVSWIGWETVWLLVFGTVARLDLGWDWTMSGLAAALGAGLGAVALWELGASDRREEREYYSEDDLDGTWVSRRPGKAPGAPSILA